MSAEGPRRLLDHGDDLDGVLRGALEAERADKIDDARLSRIAQAMAASGAGAAVHASLPPPSIGKTLPGPKSTSWLGSKGAIALLAIAFIGGLSATGFYVGREPSSRDGWGASPELADRAPGSVAPTEQLSAIVARPESASEQAPTVGSVVTSTATVSPSDLPSAPPGVVPTSPARHVRSVANTESTTEVDEIALLAQAHDSLRGDPARSLALCNEHQARFANGHFAQEREAVAITALVYLGRRDEGRHRWSAFLKRYPSSSHRAHLESLFAAPSAH